MRRMSWKELFLGEVDIDPEYSDVIRDSRRRRFRQMASIASSYGLLAAVVLTIAFWNEPALPVVSLWCGASAILAILAFWNSRPQDTSTQNIDRYEYEATRHTVISGGVWGMLTAALILTSGNDQEWLLGVLVASVLCVGAFLHSNFPKASFGFSTLVVIGTVLGLVLDHQPRALETAILLLGCTFALQRFAAMNYANHVRRELSSIALEESRETVAVLLNDFEAHSADWLWRVDENGLIERPSERFTEAADMKLAQLEGASFCALFSTAAADHLDSFLVERKAFRDEVFEVMLPTGIRWWSLSGQPSADGGFRGVGSDITQQRAAQESIAYFKEFDELTGLPNRAMLIQHLDEAERKQQDGGASYALFCIDLDNFKSINDTLGHPIGDVLLKVVAERLTDNADGDMFVARLGGDEFAIFQPGCEHADAEEIADLVLDSLLAPVVLDGKEVLVSGSVGVAIGPDDGTDPTVLMKNAELALYRAKAQGRGCVRFFEASMDEDARHRADLESGLRAALSHDAMDVYFQPLVNTRTRETVGYETLLRWNRPGHGLVSPAAFIACAEETGIIVPLGEWVIRKAIQEASEWKEEVSVAINLSPAQMSNPSLISTVVSALAASQLDPNRLEIEITENLLMQETDQNLRTLHALKDLGVRIALDDFGTGFSSLSYLRAFPFDKIKIDQCFVRDIETSPENHAIVRAVITLARDLGMSITAEGVENEQQATILAGLGCKTVQGYLYSRPVPSTELQKKPPSEIPGRKVLHLPRRA